MFNLFKIFTVIAICYIPSNLFSHGGGLNSEGCHTNRKTSDYHCHKKKINSIGKYNRKSFRYKSYPPNTDIGFYTLSRCDTNIDHVVSLKDAHDSGAAYWSSYLKEKFANDKSNHVVSCIKVNSSKGASAPKDFLRKSRDNKSLEFNIIPFCSYLKIYHKIKLKYKLSFYNNSRELFSQCGLKIQ